MASSGSGWAGRSLALLVLLAAAPAALVVASSGSRAASHQSDTVAPEVAELATRGAELYALNCAVCHGATGGGLPEAKLAFPEDHRDCTRCHRPSNRIVQPLTEPFVDNDMFAVGDPPALRRLDLSGTGGSPLADGSSLEARSPVVGQLSAVAAPTALLAYVAATMPRYDPGRLTADEYAAITAHLLVVNDRLDEVVQLLGSVQDSQ